LGVGPTVASDVVVGNVFDKYGTRNPVYRWVVGGYFEQLSKLLPPSLPARVLEVGCGEGHIAGWMRRRYAAGSLIALDLAPGMLVEARARYPGVEFGCASASELPFADGQFDLVLFLEVLEHLPDPRQALTEARRVCAGQLVASVPREPVWQVLNLLRGAYWGRMGNTPGHLQHWSRASFLQLLQESWVVRRVASPLPWTLALCHLP
jgi:ubiquinone/menaquinone biosynthesis C-methylase UbiE